MPTLTLFDSMLNNVATRKKAQLQAMAVGGRSPFPLPDAVARVVSDRLSLASEHLRVGDGLLMRDDFRSSISRHYYAMYHAARAVVYADFGGDDHERHVELPRHLPAALAGQPQREQELTDARLLRNQADYDPYPAIVGGWEQDARLLASITANFLQECEHFALVNGHL